MAHITEFKINGLVGRKGVYAKRLHRDVNVFFGINGSGKTTLLKILNSAMSRDASILQDAYFNSAEVTVYSLKFNKHFTHTIKMPKKAKSTSSGKAGEIEEHISDLDEFDELPSELNWTITPALDASKGWVHTYLPTTRLFIGGLANLRRAGFENRTISESALESHFAEALQRIWALYYADMLGTVREAQEAGLRSILREVLSPSRRKKKTENNNSDAAYQSVMNFLQRQERTKSPLISIEKFSKRYQSDAILRHVVDDIESVEEQIEQSMHPKNKLQEIISKMFINKVIDFSGRNISVANTDGSDVNLASLSAGEKHLLWIMVETLLVNESTVLIDEPELSMHIDWQKTLISSMRQVNPSAQLILATHSPEIMSDIEDDRIFRV